MLVAHYDTHPENTGYNGYYGNWGNYPWLPSGTIITNDMQNGLFLFRLQNSSSVSSPNELPVSIFPNPAQDEVNVSFNLDQSRLIRLSVVNSIGQILRSQNLGERQSGQERIALNPLPAGIYWLMFDVEGTRIAKPLLKR